MSHRNKSAKSINRRMSALYDYVADVKEKQILKVQAGLHWADWAKPQ